MSEIMSKQDKVVDLVCRVEFDKGEDQDNGHGDIYHIPDAYYLKETIMREDAVQWDHVLHKEGFSLTVISKDIMQ